VSNEANRLALREKAELLRNAARVKQRTLHVITGLDPVIHVLPAFVLRKSVDGRVKPGHDG
jgi:hypothetical protein